MNDYKLDTTTNDNLVVESYQCVVCGKNKLLDSDLCQECEDLTKEVEDYE